MINTTENCDDYKDRLLISGHEFDPDEDFYRDIYYVDDSQIDCPERKINLDDLKVYKKCLIELIREHLPKENRYKSKGCDENLPPMNFGHTLFIEKIFRLDIQCSKRRINIPVIGKNRI